MVTGNNDTHTFSGNCKMTGCGGIGADAQQFRDSLVAQFQERSHVAALAASRGSSTGRSI